MAITLVIPDLHNKVDWVEPFLATHPHDKVIFVGDYWDSFNDTAEDAKKTALFVKRMLEAGHTLLKGNHDMPYAIPFNKDLWCPGWNIYKWAEVRKILSIEDFDKMPLCIEDQGFLISHAGVHPRVFAHPQHGLTIPSIKKQCEEAYYCVKNNGIHPIFDWGRIHGGNQEFGGIIWLRWCELEPIPGLNQIVGHTLDNIVRFKLIEGSSNYCIDTHCKYVGEITDGLFHSLSTKPEKKL